MNPNIIKVQFLDDKNDRRILCTLSDGGKVKIVPLNSFGEEGFEQYNATLVQMQVTQPLAERSKKWLHGHTDNVPSVKSLVKPPKTFISKVNALRDELTDAIAALLNIAEKARVPFTIEQPNGTQKHLADVAVGSKDKADLYPYVKEVFRKNGKITVVLDNGFYDEKVPLDSTELSTDDLAAINDSMLHLLDIN